MVNSIQSGGKTISDSIQFRFDKVEREKAEGYNLL